MKRSGYPGVTWQKWTGWRARGCKNGKEIHIGCFANKEDAIRARKYFEETGIIRRKSDAS